MILPLLDGLFHAGEWAGAEFKAARQRLQRFAFETVVESDNANELPEMVAWNYVARLWSSGLIND